MLRSCQKQSCLYVLCQNTANKLELWKSLCQTGPKWPTFPLENEFHGWLILISCVLFTDRLTAWRSKCGCEEKMIKWVNVSNRCNKCQLKHFWNTSYDMRNITRNNLKLRKQKGWKISMGANRHIWLLCSVIKLLAPYCIYSFKALNHSNA